MTPTPNLLVLHVRRLLHALLVAFLCAVHLAASADVRYTYDEAGRLVGVYAPNGDAAQYIYDAAGNITEIKRFSSTQLSIIEFSPNSGPIGATVAIHGTGFSTTPGNNAVAFNGTAATVSTATSSKLTVAVPSGATTGPIAITVGAASATSATSFVVTPSSGTPTITNISPAVGSPTTAVAITGTNYETTTFANTVVFNTTFAVVSSSTSTSLATTVPVGAASGKVKVRTSRGTAVSSADFLVPFGTYTTADLVTSARVAIDGAPTTFSIPTAGKVAMILFDGIQGQNLGIGLGPNTFIPAGGSATVHVKRPDNVDLVSSVGFSSATSIDLPTLPLTGTYTIAVVPGASWKLDGTVTVSTDVSATIASAGTTVGAATTRAGQNASFTFNGAAAQTVGFYVSGVSAAVQPSKVDVIAPNGYSIASTTSSGTSAYIQALSLPLTGQYRIRVSPQGNGVGTMSAQFGVPDLTVNSVTPGSITVNQNGSYSIPMTVVIANQGTVGAKPLWFDYAYLSADTVLDATDRSVTNLFRTADLASGGTYTINLTGTTQTSVSPGTYQLVVKTDGYDSGGLYVPTPTGLIESNEGNNVHAAVAVTLPDRPDLSIVLDSVGTITVSQNGSYNIPVTWTVTNLGPSAAKASWYDECYLSTDGTLAAPDPMIGYVQRTTDLAPSASYSVTKTCTTAATVGPGAYTLFVKVDGYDSSAVYSPHHLVAESNETNNTVSTSISLPTRSDLIIAAPSIGTITPNQDGSYNLPVSATVTNQGAVAAKANWYDYCYLSTDTSLTTADRAIGWTQRTTDLATSGTYVFSKTCLVPTTFAPGTYELFVKTDGYESGGMFSAFSSLVEADENNNTASTQFSLPAKTDLVAGSISLGAITVNGNGSYNIPITVIVTNSGGMFAKSSWYDYCYLSSDGTLDTSDDYIGYVQRVADVAVTTSYTFTKTCTTATTTTPGSYTLFFKADGYSSGSKYSAQHALTEADEGNNVSSIGITLPTK